MKKITLCIILCNFVLLNAKNTKGIVGDKNWTRSWTNFKAKSTDYNETTNILSGVIDKNTTLFKKNIYLLSGNVYVTNGATLTIEPGTLIRGDYATTGTLIITKGSKIIAQGEETNPIIFTSNKSGGDRKPGDWGGVVVFGDATTNNFSGQLDFDFDVRYNSYGGTNPNSNSGILKYIRIEFAGRKGRSKSELNGLSLAGVGKGTVINSIQVSHSNGDSFKFYGGELNLENLFSYRSLDDDYDFTEGTQATIKNSLAIRNPYISGSGKSRCFEIESFGVAANSDLTKKLTNVVAENVTLLNDEKEDSGLTREAIFVKERSSLEIKNSVISGFKATVLLDQKIKVDFENLGKIKIQDMLFNNCDSYIESELVENNSGIKSWYNNENFKIECSKNNNIDFFMDIDVQRTPDFRIKQDKIFTSRLAAN
jgi:hypothetical protein